MGADRSHRIFVQPADDRVSVWRFMDFAKFAHLLLTSSLYLPRADCLGDPFEGALPLRTLKALEPSLRNGYAAAGIAPEKVEQILRGGPAFPGLGPGVLEHTKAMYKLQRQWTYVSCWHANPSESAAMWRLYTRSNDAIAIRSTYAQLADALPKQAIVGLVHYVDFDEVSLDLTNMFAPFVIKRRSFEHEREVRAVVQELPLVSADRKEASLVVGINDPEGRDKSAAWHIEWRPNEKRGISLPIRPDALIEEIYVAPSANDWFLDLVRQMVAKAAMSVPVRRSSLDSEPVW